MKRIAIGVLAVAISTAAGGAFAQNYNYGDRGNSYNTTRTDRAQVLRIQRVGHDHGPQTYQTQECWNERTRNYDSGYYRDDNNRLYRGNSNGKVAGTLLGALVGGALGNQVGKGDGKKAATIAGAVIGGAVGNNVADHNDNNGYNDGYGDQNDDNYRYSDYRDDGGVVRRCRTVITANENYDGHQVGYQVTYRYAGQTYQAMTDSNPGRWIRVRVDVQPADGYQR